MTEIPARGLLRKPRQGIDERGMHAPNDRNPRQGITTQILLERADLLDYAPNDRNPRQGITTRTGIVTSVVMLDPLQMTEIPARGLLRIPAWVSGMPYQPPNDRNPRQGITTEDSPIPYYALFAPSK